MGRPLTDDIRAAIKAQLTAVPKPSERAKHVQRRTTAGLWARPFHSDALGVSPSQIEEQREYYRKHGIDLDFDSQGRAIITGPDQYRKACKASGLWSGAQGYGLPNRELTGRGKAQERERLKEHLRRIERGDYDGI